MFTVYVKTKKIYDVMFSYQWNNCFDKDFASGIYFFKVYFENVELSRCLYKKYSTIGMDLKTFDT